MLSSADGASGGLEPLGAMLPAMLSTLGEGIEAEHTAGCSLDAGGAACLLALVAQLTTGAPGALRPFLRQVDSLPDGIPALAGPAELVAAARQDITPWEQLSQVGAGPRGLRERGPAVATLHCIPPHLTFLSCPLSLSTQFAARASSMTPSLRHRSLGALRKVLSAQQAALFAAADAAALDGGDDAAAAPSACRPEVAAAAWRLAVLSSELADAELAVSEIEGACTLCCALRPRLAPDTP